MCWNALVLFSNSWFVSSAQDLNAETELQSANGQRVKAFTVFSSALRYFRNHALQELSDQSQTKILNEDIRWVITVPAIWKEPAKQFMRETAYEVNQSRSQFI